MPPFLYRRPNTGNNVQAWADDEPDDDEFHLLSGALPLRALGCI
jgi:hypothetical protein